MQGVIEFVNVYHAGRIIDGAWEFLYALLAERPAGISISHREMPTMVEHRAFMIRRPYRAWFIIAADTQPARDDRGRTQDFEASWVGSVHATTQNEVGVQILREHQRKGYARAALVTMMRDLQPLPASPSVRRGRYIANVIPHNEASIALFESLGGKLIQITYEL